MTRLCTSLLLAVIGAEAVVNGTGAPRLAAYYAHAVVEDRNGVIAPWYKGLNGQLDERARIAVDVYKRYPWVGKPKAVLAAPDFIYSSHWSISPEGEIRIPPTNDWMCGDLSQRAWSIVKGLTAYYQYSGDPIAFVYIPRVVDYILDYAQTDSKHPWPRFPIATPTNGRAYGKCDPNARDQLDLCAITGIEVLRAYRLTGTVRYRDAARHWGDVFAQKCNYRDTDLSPWNRYVDPSVVGWSDELTGTTSIIVEFLDCLIDSGYTGRNGLIVKARNRGRDFLNRVILPKWIENDTWGRTYWDWDNPVMCGMVAMCADHFMRHPADYPTWKHDLRNMLPLVFNRNGADPNSMGDAYSGAWAFPESSVCCGTSLSYNQYTAAPTWIRYGVLADDPWAREIGRRMILMATYDSQENGVVKDGLLGESVATGEWSNLAHPWPLCQVMEALAWMPRELGPNRENHIMRSSSVVRRVVYESGRIAYVTADAAAPAVDVLRLSFVPTAVRANGKPLARRASPNGSGYAIESLRNGDCLVTIRHDARTSVVVAGPDPERPLPQTSIGTDGPWSTAGGMRVASRAGAAMFCPFHGNRVRLIGRVDTDGGQADVFVDGVLQLTIVDFWNPSRRDRQVLFEKKGLRDGEHTLAIVARGSGNPLSKGARLYVEGVRASAATGSTKYGEGSGPRGPQRMVFGYTGRKDIVDSRGRAWKPATEWVIRAGGGTDTVASSWWTHRRSMYIGNTADPELYRYGVHGKEFWVNLTVAPGAYNLTLRFAEAAPTPWVEREDGWKPVLHDVAVSVNGREEIASMNVADAAGGTYRAVDRVIRGVRPDHGMVRVHFRGTDKREAMVQALEIVPVR